MGDISDHTDDLHENLTSEENHQSLIKPIQKDVIHRICSGQVSQSIF